MIDSQPPTDQPLLITAEVGRRAAARAAAYAGRAEAIHRAFKAREPEERTLFPGTSASAAFWPVAAWFERADHAGQLARRAALAAELAISCAADQDLDASREHAEIAVRLALEAAGEVGPENVAAERWATWADQVEAAILGAGAPPEPVAPCSACGTPTPVSKSDEAGWCPICASGAHLLEVEPDEESTAPMRVPSSAHQELATSDTETDAIVIDEFELDAARARRPTLRPAVMPTCEHGT